MPEDQGLSVLIADDEEVVRLFLARVLEDMGCSCDFAVDGRECLERFSSGKTYDVLFLDLVMPRMDGEQVLQQVASKYPKTSVVMLSVQDDEEAIKELLAVGATVYLTKPITADGIRNVVTRLQGLRNDK